MGKNPGGDWEKREAEIRPPFFPGPPLYPCALSSIVSTLHRIGQEDTPTGQPARDPSLWNANLDNNCRTGPGTMVKPHLRIRSSDPHFGIYYDVTRRPQSIQARTYSDYPLNVSLLAAVIHSAIKHPYRPHLRQRQNPMRQLGPQCAEPSGPLHRLQISPNELSKPAFCHDFKM